MFDSNKDAEDQDPAKEITGENSPEESTNSKPANKPFKNITNIVQDSYNCQDSEEEDKDKKKKFDNFLTYRKRLTRVVFVQALYMHDMNNAVLETLKDEIHKLPKSTSRSKADELYGSMLFFYRKVFFPNTYGSTKKSQKIDERFLKDAIVGYLKCQEEIDEYIQKFIKTGWTISRLNSVIRAILRAGVYEALYNTSVEHKIIISEYTNLASGCLTRVVEVNFINALLDKIVKTIRKV